MIMKTEDNHVEKWYDHRRCCHDPEDKRFVSYVGRYADIMGLQRPAHDLTHPPMAISRRAKLFKPFAALSGFEEAVAEKNIVYVARAERSEEEKARTDRELTLLFGKCRTRRMCRETPVLVRVTCFTQYTLPAAVTPAAGAVSRGVDENQGTVDRACSWNSDENQSTVDRVCSWSSGGNRDNLAGVRAYGLYETIEGTVVCMDPVEQTIRIKPCSDDTDAAQPLFFDTDPSILRKEIACDRILRFCDIEKIVMIEKAEIEKAGIERAGTEKAEIEQTGIEKAEIEKAGTEKAGAEKTAAGKTAIIEKNAETGKMHSTGAKGA